MQRLAMIDENTRRKKTIKAHVCDECEDIGLGVIRAAGCLDTINITRIEIQVPKLPTSRTVFRTLMPRIWN